VGTRSLLAFACPFSAFAVGTCAAAAPAPSGVRPILFWSDTPQPTLLSIRADGSHRHRIRTPQNSKRPRLSPDRTWIVFDGTPRGKPPLSDFDIQLVRPDGTGRRTLTSSEDWDIDAAWSPDGSRISFSREPPGADWRNSWIWTMRSDGGDVRPLVKGQSARWAPDGRRLVFATTTPSSDGDLFVVDADGTGLHHLLATPRLEQPADWSPDGKRILFTRWFGDRAADVFVMDADGMHVRRLTRAAGADVAGGWSPDGSKIVFTSTRLGRQHLFVMRANGTRQHAITRNGANDFEPSWR
jgi:Tol biopolymer transport system component